MNRTVKSFEPRSYFISIVGNYDLPGTYFQVYAPSEQSYSTCLKKIGNNFNEAKDLIFAALQLNGLQCLTKLFVYII